MEKKALQPNPNEDSLKKNIVATLCYFKVLGWPMSAFEVYRYLVRKEKIDKELTFWEVKKALNGLKKDSLVVKDGVFYFLGKNSGYFDERIRREKKTLKKWLLAKYRIGFLRHIPYLRAVFISGSVAVGNVTEDSDIDLLIVAAQGRVWMVRFLLHLVLGLLGWRRHDEKVKDRLCLNHFLSTGNLEVPFSNIYNAQTYAHLLCLLDTDNYFTSFCRRNDWVGDFLYWGLEFNKIKKTSCLYDEGSRLQTFFEFLLNNFFGDMLEKALSWLQKKKIKFQAARSAGERIYIKEGQLAFHPRKKEKNLIAKYEKELKKYNLD